MPFQTCSPAAAAAAGIKEIDIQRQGETAINLPALEVCGSKNEKLPYIRDLNTKRARLLFVRIIFVPLGSVFSVSSRPGLHMYMFAMVIVKLKICFPTILRYRTKAKQRKLNIETLLPVLPPYSRRGGLPHNRRTRIGLIKPTVTKLFIFRG